MADIRQMFRQILIHEDDRKYQMIVWRNEPNEILKYYLLNTVTYGTSSAPFLATRCIVQLADEEEAQFPKAAHAVLNGVYVDNFMTGANDLSEANQLKKDIISILAKGQFELRKFCANNDRLLDDTPEEHREPFVIINNSETVKTLGLTWQPQEDLFKLNYVPEFHNQTSKRTVLSDLGKNFDPLGLIGPIVVKGKLFMQQLWKSKLGWDSPLPEELSLQWDRYIQQLNEVKFLSCPRHLLGQSEYVDIQLHAFSDSSEAAYGTCCYLRSLSRSGEVNCQLICSKSRVSPIKSTSLPRLELQAAVMMAELVDRLTKILQLKINDIFYHTDSQIVLAWISQPSYTWVTFVANRVARIQELSQAEQSRHVYGKMNPADLISRGCTADTLQSSSLWFQGPSFLISMHESWRETATISSFEEIPERKSSNKALTAAHPQYYSIMQNVKYNDSLPKLERIFAYVYRFYNKARKIQTTAVLSTLPTVEESNHAHNGLIINMQLLEFKNEFNRLQNSEQVEQTSRLRNLCPFIARDGLLRSLHAAPQALLGIIRQRYWPLDGLNMARREFNKCQRCFRVKPKSVEQFMGNLPPERVSPEGPFLTTGVDFCGPFKLRYQPRARTIIKGYIAVFVCFTTKAVHLEAVGDLTTASFIAALRRFIARRGLCRTIFCDNATNFVGARNELKELARLFDSESLIQIKEICRVDRIEWRFIPPRSPHFGGLWEAAVKSAKYHFIRVAANAILNYEELNTLTAQIEAILNSRPITPLSSSPNDLEPLTPGHFLIGRPLTSIPEPCLLDASISRLTRFRRLQQIQQQFWKRWSRDYLLSLQERTRWYKKSEILEAVTIVLIHDDNLPPYKWLMGRILKTFPGSDGIERVAEVKTKLGIYKRTANKLYPLPM
ncbi:uncharacterized protein LOC129945059 [Eupeodes corollae]|uniref:uncharacterized protein LOC129945059 n=1 Tax=Eupeodes corollae TaxID=290404 RepID=UPI002492786D|nr:uncharacterized protein LOC129945059 [Eupeodes corollae]